MSPAAHSEATEPSNTWLDSQHEPLRHGNLVTGLYWAGLDKVGNVPQGVHFGRVEVVRPVEVGSRARWCHLLGEGVDVAIVGISQFPQKGIA